MPPPSGARQRSEAFEGTRRPAPPRGASAPRRSRKNPLRVYARRVRPRKTTYPETGRACVSLGATPAASSTALGPVDGSAKQHPRWKGAALSSGVTGCCSCRVTTANGEATSTSTDLCRTDARAMPAARPARPHRRRPGQRPRQPHRAGEGRPYAAPARARTSRLKSEELKRRNADPEERKRHSERVKRWWASGGRARSRRITRSRSRRGR